MDQNVLPVICDFKAVDLFLKTDIPWCILMDFHICALEDLMCRLHRANKRVILHLDMIHGLCADEAGTQYVCQKLHADGVISTKAKVIETSKKNHVLTIMRLFMIDSRSIERGCELGNRLQPDFLEVLPANRKNGISYVRERSSLPLIAGGLIRCKEDIEECLALGVCAVTTSSLSLCREMKAGRA